MFLVYGPLSSCLFLLLLCSRNHEEKVNQQNTSEPTGIFNSIQYIFHTKMLGLRRAPRSSKSFFFLPRRLILVRHGESCANVDRTMYAKIPDWKIELTAKGVEQAKACGEELKRIVGNERVYLYHSPYCRAKQTLAQIRNCLDATQIEGEREDDRLREQEVGNLQCLENMESIWAERQRSSRFYYRFPFGESAADVCDRVSLFLDSLFRERRELHALRVEARQQEVDEEEHNVIIVCHGLFLRIFLGRWYKLPLEVFEAMRNPPNCGMVVLERDNRKGRLVMRPQDKALFGDDPALATIRFDGTDNDTWYATNMVQRMEALAAQDVAAVKK